MEIHIEVPVAEGVAEIVFPVFRQCERIIGSRYDCAVFWRNYPENAAVIIQESAVGINSLAIAILCGGKHPAAGVKIVVFINPVLVSVQPEIAVLYIRTVVFLPAPVGYAVTDSRSSCILYPLTGKCRESEKQRHVNCG